ncbi:hypothetical protein MUK42_00121 [Musa troglodytarum]|uniref:Uncharacterized protein n=1 Tax=Musa troglodytarum TaxID=320322 RepID=A0A9E7JTF4_9LILI|nr:hypothetical protein MUK42_00121 [Musa troglodytarum]
MMMPDFDHPPTCLFWLGVLANYSVGLFQKWVSSANTVRCTVQATKCIEQQPDGRTTTQDKEQKRSAYLHAGPIFILLPSKSSA